MKQPELGRELSALRKKRNLTQEELVQKSHVSVRTIQRIENGEVVPRLSTVKILLNTFGESYDSFLAKVPEASEQRHSSNVNRNTLLVAAISGAIYLVSEIILAGMDLAKFTGSHNWGNWINATYIAITVTMVVSFTLFARGFVVLSKLFENSLLMSTTYLLIVGTIGIGLLDIGSLAASTVDSLWIPYSCAALLLGSISIAFGVSLIQLQDGMGELARVAGVLEIVLGCLLITVVLFFITYVILIPATIIEILILSRGYEYLGKLESQESGIV